MNHPISATLEDAFDHCRKIALGHYENFPVGSLLVPKPLRKHFYALYAFMRTADDYADLPHRTRQERLDLLSHWRTELHSIFSGVQSQEPVFIALADTIAKFDFPIPLFDRLLDAFEFDARGEVRFITYSDLRRYTSGSADPVGELVLGLFGYSDAERIRLSNEICSGLQLLNFIQDLNEDLSNERYYFPEEDCLLYGVILGSTMEPTDDLRELVLFETDRVEAMLDAGAELAESVSGRLRFELRAVIGGARKMIVKIREQQGDMITKRPKLSKYEHAVILIKSLMSS